MLVLILQSALLLAIAYILGCILGCLLRTMFGANDSGVAPVAATATAAAATGVAASAAAPKPVAKPEPVREPEPVALVPASPKPAPKPKAAPAAKAAPKPKAPAKPKAAPVAKAPAKPKPAAKSGAAPALAGMAPIAAGTEVDNLKLIKGIGLQNEARLNAFGVAYFQQIADWKKADIDSWGMRLAFPGRIEREDWVSQAKILAKGGTTDFANRVKGGEVSTSVGKGTVGDLGKMPKGLLDAAPASGPDNLTLIDGVGNALEKRLFAIGIYTFKQIADLSVDEAKWVGLAVGFPGRVERENWVAESKVLAAGGMTEHAKRVEEGKIGTSRKSTDAEKASQKK